MATCQDDGTRFSIGQAGGPSGLAVTADSWRHDRHAALRRDRSRVGDLVVLHGAHLLGPGEKVTVTFSPEPEDADALTIVGEFVRLVRAK